MIRHAIVLAILIGCTAAGCKRSNRPQATPPPTEANVPAGTMTQMQDPAKEPNQSEGRFSKTAFCQGWAKVLSEFVGTEGSVDYTRLKRKRVELRDLLDGLREFDPNEYASWAQNDRMAFWLNVYNAQAIKIAVDNYPLRGSRWMVLYHGADSVRLIDGLRTRYKFLVMDEEFTLAEVESRFFRKEFAAEPRLLLGLTTLTRGGPPLPMEPFVGERLWPQVDDQVRRFLQGHGLSIAKDRVILSALFDQTVYGQVFLSRYGIDRKFKDHPACMRAVLNFVSPYITTQDRSFLEVGNYTIDFLRYDWTLNDTPRGH